MTGHCKMLEILRYTGRDVDTDWAFGIYTELSDIARDYGSRNKIRHKRMMLLKWVHSVSAVTYQKAKDSKTRGVSYLRSFDLLFNKNACIV